jgi:hypothetical protein
MKNMPASDTHSALHSTIATSALGGVLGGSLAAALVIGFTEILKGILAVVSRQHTWVIILAPLIGLGLSVLVLYGFGLSDETKSAGEVIASLVGHSYIEKRPHNSKPDSHTFGSSAA